MFRLHFAVSILLQLHIAHATLQDHSEFSVLSILGFPIFHLQFKSYTYNITLYKIFSKINWKTIFKSTTPLENFFKRISIRLKSKAQSESNVWYLRNSFRRTRMHFKCTKNGVLRNQVHSLCARAAIGAKAMQYLHSRKSERF